MGFVADDPTLVQDVGNAAKRFYNAGTSIKCNEERIPRCCPLFTGNDHVVEWLFYCSHIEHGKFFKNTILT